MSDEKRDPVEVVELALMLSGAAKGYAHVVVQRLRAAGLLRHEAEIAARERAARDKALREAAAVVASFMQPAIVQTANAPRGARREEREAALRRLQRVEAAILALIDRGAGE